MSQAMTEPWSVINGNPHAGGDTGLEYWSGGRSRHVRKRILVRGVLVLQTVAHLGNGEESDVTNMALLTDPCDGRTPLLTGATMVGALRSYLRDRERGYRKPAESGDWSVALFGDDKLLNDANPDGTGVLATQSPLIINDAYGVDYGIEHRDGVAIDGASRTALDNKKFDLDMWQAGTRFPLCFELLICGRDEAAYIQQEAGLKSALRAALEGLDDDLGCITLGARKSRGYGRIKVENWCVREFDFATTQGLNEWLLDDEFQQVEAFEPARYVASLSALGDALEVDKREYFDVRATMRLIDSLMIRTAGSFEDAPDAVHLHSRQPDSADDTRGAAEEPALSGTTLAGGLSARAKRIARTLTQKSGRQSQAKTLISEVFGSMDEMACASRFECQERALENVEAELVQSRVSLDYFTGGAREARLFNGQPVFEKTSDVRPSRSFVLWRLRLPADTEIGLLLQVLKDLWCTDLALGGEQSIGRGRQLGIEARLELRRAEQSHHWALQERSSQGDLKQLEDFAGALKEKFSVVKAQQTTGGGASDA